MPEAESKEPINFLAYRRRKSPPPQRSSSEDLLGDILVAALAALSIKGAAGMLESLIPEGIRGVTGVIIGNLAAEEIKKLLEPPRKNPSEATVTPFTQSPDDFPPIA